VLYGFLGPAATFTGLVAVALGTVLLALRHAPWLAGLGLLGGYVAPLLVASGAPSVWPAAGLVAVLTATAFGLARLKGWTPLAWLALGATALWSLALVLPALREPEAYGAHLVAMVILGFALGAYRAPHLRRPSAADRRIAHLVVIAAAAATAAFVTTAPLATTPLLVGGVVVATIAAGATLHVRFRRLALVAALLAVLIVGSFDAIAPVLHEGRLVDPNTIGVVTDRSIDRVILVSAAFAALFGIGGFLAQRRTGDPRLALAAAGTPVAILGVAALRFRLLDHDFAFGVTALALAAAYALVTEDLTRRSGEDRRLFAPSGVYAAAAAACVGLAVALLVPGTQLPLGFAGAAAAIAWVWTARPLPLLRFAAAGAAGLALASLGWNPRLLAVAPDATPYVNAYLTALGLPALALGAAARLFGRNERHWTQVVLEGLASALAVAYLWRATEHGLSGAFPEAAPPFLDGYGMRVVVMLGAAATFERLRAATGAVAYSWAALGAYALAALAALAVLALHPFLTNAGVAGGLVYNELLTGYLGPGLAALALALTERRANGANPLARAAEVAAHALVVAYLLAEIAVLFRGPELASRMGQGEFWAYSALGLAYGIGLLAAGLATGRRALRLASGAVLIGTVVKVFVFDLAGLEGLMRALSFIGLGLVLVGIGLVYQRLLARRAD
jgi:uncharacterized membrane protein